MLPSFRDYLSEEAADALLKVAEERAKKKRPQHPAWVGLKTFGGGLGGAALGGAAGLGLAYGAEKMLGKKNFPKYIAPAAGILGAGTMLAERMLR